MSSIDITRFILDPVNSIFLYPIVIMLAIAILEIGSILIGMSLSGFIDHFILDVHPETSTNIDHNVPEVDSAIGVSNTPLHLTFLSWLNVGRVPVLILLVLFLTSFGLIGYITQYVFLSYTNDILPVSIVSIGGFFVSLYIVHGFGKLLARLIPKEETTAVSVDSLIGKEAVITIGTAKKDKPAEARVKDEYGNDHYIMVVPMSDESFTKDDSLVIIEKVEGRFVVDKFEIR